MFDKLDMPQIDVNQSTLGGTRNIPFTNRRMEKQKEILFFSYFRYRNNILAFSDKIDLASY